MFKDYQILLGLVVVGIIVTALSVLKSADIIMADATYRDWQHAYYEAIGEDEYEIEVKQVNLETEGITMVDRFSRVILVRQIRMQQVLKGRWLFTSDCAGCRKRSA